MRKQGYRIKDTRLKFKKGLQEEFIKRIKQRSGLSWKILASEFNICDHTLRIEWRKEKSTLPKKIAMKLIEKYPFERWEKVQSEWIEKILHKNWGQKLGGEKNKKTINLPKESEDLAEILGIILGDGHLEKRTLTITGNYYEKQHHEYTSKKIKSLFGLNSKTILIKEKNTTILKIYSIELIKYLKNNGLVLGNKIKNKASFPKWVFEKKEFIYGALRGLFDTDGGIFNKQKNYNRAIIEIQTHSPYIRKNVFSLFKKSDFRPSKSTTNIRIQHQKEIHRFFKLIGSSNPKNIIRYNYFIKEGYIPLKEKLNKEVINFKGNIPFKCDFSLMEKSELPMIKSE